MNFCSSAETSSLADLEAPLLASEEEEAMIAAAKETRKKKSAEDDESEGSVIETRCNLFTGTYFFGFAVGIIFQACSFCALSILGLNAVGSTTVATDSSSSSSIPINTPLHKDLSVAAVYALLLFSRYWVFVCMVLPPLFYALVARRRNNNSRRRRPRSGVGKGKTAKQKRAEDRHASARVLLGAFFDCFRFQFGVLGGSLILSSGVGFYSLVVTTPVCALLAYYGVCVAVSFCVLHVLQVFVDSVCANVSSVELTVKYDDDEEEGDYYDYSSDEEED